MIFLADFRTHKNKKLMILNPNSATFILSYNATMNGIQEDLII
jgi:hypothetical protein